jgi:hypothetical protein
MLTAVRDEVSFIKELTRADPVVYSGPGAVQDQDP